MKRLFPIFTLALAVPTLIIGTPETKHQTSSIDWAGQLRPVTITTFISSLVVQAASPFLGFYTIGTTYKTTGKVVTSLLKGTKAFTLSAASGYGLMATSTYTNKIAHDNFPYKP